MKKIITLFFAILFFPAIIFAQAQLSIYGQSTIMGFQKGVEAGYFTKKGFGISGFYQATQVASFENSVSNYPFYGAALNVPIKYCGDILVSGQLRTGVVNGQYVIVTPQIETTMLINRWMGAAITAGYRAGMPAVGFKMTFSLTK